MSFITVQYIPRTAYTIRTWQRDKVNLSAIFHIRSSASICDLLCNIYWIPSTGTPDYEQSEA